MGRETATFAGGCFWCMQHDFDPMEGVLVTTVGYTGGHTTHPTYEEVCKGTTGHFEAIQVVFDPQKISYQGLVDAYWRMIDPTRNDGQFCDFGPQYRPAIFYCDETQKRIALASKQALEKTMQPILVEILPLATFYPAEEHHQKFYDKNPDRYHSYCLSCRRDKRLNELWEE